MKKAIVAGLIKGRHDLPVSKYIIGEEIKDVLDSATIRLQVRNWFDENIEQATCIGCGINQSSYEDVEVFTSSTHLIVYVTGLSVVLAEVIRLSAIRGVKLTLMNFDRNSGGYVPQRIF